MKVLSTDKAPAAIGPYSQALVSGGTVFVSGQIPVDPSTGMIAETIAEQTAQSLSNIENILAENGMTMENVIKTSVFLSDLSDFAAMNEVYASRLKRLILREAALRWRRFRKAARWKLNASQ